MSPSPTAQSPRAAIVFDLDGTLIHSAPDIQAAANAMLADEGLEPLDLAAITRFIGNGVPKLVERVMQARALPSDQHARLLTAMLKHYRNQQSALTRLFPGVRQALDSLKQQGYPLGICTNKPEAATHEVLRDFALGDLFDVVVGGDSLAQRKPDPAPLEAAFAALPPGLARLYVGDSEIDAETAQRAGAPFALFTQGYRKQPVDALDHRLAFDDWRQLTDWLETAVL